MEEDVHAREQGTMGNLCTLTALKKKNSLKKMAMVLKKVILQICNSHRIKTIRKYIFTALHEGKI